MRKSTTNNKGGRSRASANRGCTAIPTTRQRPKHPAVHKGPSSNKPNNNINTDRQITSDKDDDSGRATAANEKVPQHVTDFLQASLKKGVVGIKTEFMEARGYVPVGNGDEQLAAFKKNHPDKNRFKDVFCLERTRVVLKGHSTDYIHANRVQGGSMKFICTQGPKENTIGDFWYMMFQEQSTQIIMLCNTVESGKPKCAQYWPLKKDDIITHGPISVCKVNETIEEVKGAGGSQQIVTSTLEMTNEGCAPRTIYHRMWTNWPDRGSPANARPLLQLRQTAAKCDVGQPVIIHCSAGIGRTGTVVLVDIGMGCVDQNITVDVRASLERMRDQRLHSVQTDLQYLFVYRSLIEYVTFKWKSLRSSAVKKWYADYDKAQPKQVQA